MGSLLWQLMKLWTMFSLCNNCKYFIFSWFPTKIIYSDRRDKDTQLTKPNFSLIAKTLSTHSSHIHPWILFVFLGMVELAVIGASNVSLVLHLQTHLEHNQIWEMCLSLTDTSWSITLDSHNGTGKSSSTKWDGLCKDEENSRKEKLEWKLVDLGGLTVLLLCVNL